MDILKRVPKESVIHLVFTTMLQKSYFSRTNKSKNSYEAFLNGGKEVSNSILKQTVVYHLKMDKLGDIITFAKIPGLEHSNDSNASRLVLFIPRNELMGLLNPIEKQ